MARSLYISDLWEDFRWETNLTTGRKLPFFAFQSRYFGNHQGFRIASSWGFRATPLIEILKLLLLIMNSFISYGFAKLMIGSQNLEIFSRGQHLAWLKKIPTYSNGLNDNKTERVGHLNIDCFLMIKILVYSDGIAYLTNGWNAS